MSIEDGLLNDSAVAESGGCGGGGIVYLRNHKLGSNEIYINDIYRRDDQIKIITNSNHIEESK